MANPEEVKSEYNITCINELEDGELYDTVVLAVAHDAFKQLDILKLCNTQRVIYDVKSILPKELADARL